MSEVQQPNSSNVRSILHKYTSEFTSTPKGKLFCKFCDCLVKSDKRFMVEAHRRSAKHQRGSFHETESSQKNVSTCYTAYLRYLIRPGMLYQILQISYFLFNFNRTNLSACFLIVYINMLCISHFSWKRRKLIGQNKVKICKLYSQNFTFLGQKIGCRSNDRLNSQWRIWHQRVDVNELNTVWLV